MSIDYQAERQSWLQDKLDEFIELLENDTEFDYTANEFSRWLADTDNFDEPEPSGVAEMEFFTDI